MNQLVVVGSINLDISIKLSHLPQDGETIIAENSLNFSGGKGLNQTVSISRLGGEVFMIGAIGDDKPGQIILDKIKAEGLKVSGITKLENVSTGVAYIAIDNEGENFIIVDPGANYELKYSDVLNHIEIIKNAKCVVLQFELPISLVNKIIEVCKEYNVPVILNPAPAVKISNIEMLRNIDYIIPNETELIYLTDILPKEASIEERARYLLDLGCKNVITTLGSKGALWMSDTEMKYYTSEKVVAVDATAAGDSFVGAFAKKITDGEDIDSSIKFANKYAAITVGKVGAQSSIPTIEEFNLTYKGNKIRGK